MGPHPSFGALYHQYSHPGNLLVIYFERPQFITNLDLHNRNRMGGGYEAMFLMEVVVNVGKEEQDRFMKEILKRKRSMQDGPT
jgi:hypothetical protein